MSGEKKGGALGSIGLYLVLLGLGLVFLALYIETPVTERPHASSDVRKSVDKESVGPGVPPAPDQPPEQFAQEVGANKWNRLLRTIYLFLEKLGLALIVIGIVDIVIHVGAVNEHFMDNIRDLIIQDSYLGRLKPEALTELTNRAFLAQVGNPGLDLDGEGSFVRFFHSDLKGFIGKPFREKATCEIICQSLDGEYLCLRDVLSYTCRKVGGSIQDRVRWVNDPDEAADVKSVSISVQKPGTSSDSRKVIADVKKFRYKYIDSEKLSDTLLPGKAPQYHIIDEPLTDYLGDDRLIVTIEAEYTIKAERFQYWQMTHLTRGLTLILKFPPELRTQVATFVQDDSRCSIFEAHGYYRINYPDWVFPDSGICWRFLGA